MHAKKNTNIMYFLIAIQIWSLFAVLFIYCELVNNFYVLCSIFRRLAVLYSILWLISLMVFTNLSVFFTIFPPFVPIWVVINFIKIYILFLNTPSLFIWIFDICLGILHCPKISIMVSSYILISLFINSSAAWKEKEEQATT